MTLGRRDFLRQSGLWLSTPWALSLGNAIASSSFEAGESSKTLVVLFLRGGADGLNLLVPFQESHYYRSRPQLAIRPPSRTDTEGRAIDLDGRFGLHPRLAPLKESFDRGIARAIHAVGHADNTRSHFEEQDTWETATKNAGRDTAGWLNRHLALTESKELVRAVSFADRLPRLLRGSVPAYALRNLEELSEDHSVFPRLDDMLSGALSESHGGDLNRGQAHELLARESRATLEGLNILEDALRKTPPSHLDYPQTPLGQRMQSAARLIRSPLHTEVIEVDVEGWDTHSEQGYGSDGMFADMAGDLAQSLNAFLKDVNEHLDDVLVLTVSDFGRTVAQNGSLGTDHGWANAVFAFGGPLSGSSSEPTVGQFPGLAPDQRNDGRDLAQTRDFRDVIAEVLTHHLGNGQIEAVLPGYRPQKIGLFEA